MTSPDLSPKEALEERVTEMVAIYLKGIHHPDEDPLENDLRAMKNTQDLKAAIADLVLEERQSTRSREIDWLDRVLSNPDEVLRSLIKQQRAWLAELEQLTPPSDPKEEQP